MGRRRAHTFVAQKVSNPQLILWVSPHELAAFSWNTRGTDVRGRDEKKDPQSANLSKKPPTLSKRAGPTRQQRQSRIRGHAVPTCRT